MKISEILTIENSNDSCIILFKEGIFLKAYERSAMRFVEKIAAYKVFRKFYKIVNTEICYLGFPISNLKELLQRKNLSVLKDTPNFLVIPNCVSNTEFLSWKKSIPLPTIEDEKPAMLLREPVKAKHYHQLQVYKLGYDILLEIHRFVAILPKEHKFTIGERIKNEAIGLSVVAYKIANGKSEKQLYEIGLEHIEVIRLLLRLLVDLKQMSIKGFVRLNTMLEKPYVEFGKRKV